MQRHDTSIEVGTAHTKAITLSEYIGKKQHAMQSAIRKQRNVNAIIDTGAQVTTIPESAVNRIPVAHNHRDALLGTAIKYGNGEIETNERLVDIGHYEVQITPDKKGMKGGCHVYQPYYHKILTRGDVHRVRISEIELMEWYGKRAHVRQSGLS